MLINCSEDESRSKPLFRILEQSFERSMLFEVIMPPSPVVIFFVEKKEKQDKSPKFPALIPFKEEPIAWAASSIKKMPFSLRNFLIFNISSWIKPAKWTITTAFVCLLIFFFKSSKSIKKFLFISQNIGLAPTLTTEDPVAIKVCVGTITSSPEPTPRTFKEISKALEQELVATAACEPTKDEIEALYSLETTKLNDINIFFIKFIISKLEIDTEIIISSNEDFSGKKSDLILNICSNFKASKYLSGTGAKDYLDIDSFKEKGIIVEFMKSLPAIYTQIHGDFMPGLSIIDMMMNTPSEEIRKYLYEEN